MRCFLFFFNTLSLSLSFPSFSSNSFQISLSPPGSNFRPESFAYHALWQNIPPVAIFFLRGTRTGLHNFSLVSGMGETRKTVYGGICCRRITNQLNASRAVSFRSLP
ncbi:hypothetical protein HDV64DRAFT_238033 [Trichoderma sp. TUCIM 5745]